jgi:hypothetical protein
MEEFQQSSKIFKNNNQEQYRIRNGLGNHADSEDSFELQDYYELDISDRVNYIRMVVVNHKYSLYSLFYEGSN